MIFVKISLPILKRLLLINATVFLLYILTAKVGLLLALPPGIATPIWPPSGIALTALILYKTNVLSGIFLGSAFTNFMILKAHWLYSSLIACAIALGSTLQAILAAYLLKKMGLKRDLLRSYKLIISFFGIAFGSCLVSSIIATLSLDGGHLIDSRDFFNTWLTWWLGDVAGMIVYTPFLLEWIKPRSLKQPLPNSFEAFQILAVTLFIALLSFGGYFQKSYPIEYMLIPCLLWCAFRLGSQITTLALVSVLVIAVWGTAHNYGPFVQATLNESLILLQVFICIVSATVLILIAVLKELQQTHSLLEISNQELEKKVKNRTATLTEKTHQLQEKTLQLRDLTFLLHQKNQLLEKTLQEIELTQKRALAREKLAYLGDLAAGIAHQMRNPLNYVINLAELSQNTLNKWMGEGLLEKVSLSNDPSEEFKAALSTVKNNLKKIFQYGKNANTIIETLIKQAQSSTGIYEFIDLNTFIDGFVNVSYHSLCAKDEIFKANLVKNYDAALEKVPIIPQDLSRCIVNILNNAYDAIVEKQKEPNTLYQPEISIKTQNLGKFFTISIRDNGSGIAAEHLNKIFTPFFTTKAGSAGFGLAITNELIVQHLSGEIKVDSVQGEYAEFTIILPTLPPIDHLKTLSEHSYDK